MSSDHCSQQSDEQLANLHLSGNSDAFRALVERYSGPLYGFARRLTGNEADAEDIAQETFVRLYENIAKLDLSQPLKPWLYRVCTNLCRNHAKKKKSLFFSQLESDDNDSSILDAIEDSELLPSEELRKLSEQDQVRSALKSLPQKYRIVVALYYFDSLSYEEIATVLSLPINTVRTHLRRAKEHLSETLSHLI